MSTTMEQNPSTDDLVFGVRKIASLVPTTERAAYHLIKGGHLPGVFAMGGQYACVPSVLREGLRARALAGLAAAKAGA